MGISNSLGFRGTVRVWSIVLFRKKYQKLWPFVFEGCAGCGKLNRPLLRYRIECRFRAFAIPHTLLPSKSDGHPCYHEVSESTISHSSTSGWCVEHYISSATEAMTSVPSLLPRGGLCVILWEGWSHRGMIGTEVGFRMKKMGA